MANSLGGEVRLDDEHEKVYHLIEHGGVEVVGAQSEQQLANDVYDSVGELGCDVRCLKATHASWTFS